MGCDLAQKCLSAEHEWQESTFPTQAVKLNGLFIDYECKLF